MTAPRWEPLPEDVAEWMGAQPSKFEGVGPVPQATRVLGAVLITGPIFVLVLVFLVVRS